MKQCRFVLVERRHFQKGPKGAFWNWHGTVPFHLCETTSFLLGPMGPKSAHFLIKIVTF
jgi:hypothetical protein